MYMGEYVTLFCNTCKALPEYKKNMLRDRYQYALTIYFTNHVKWKKKKLCRIFGFTTA